MLVGFNIRADTKNIHFMEINIWGKCSFCNEIDCVENSAASLATTGNINAKTFAWSPSYRQQCNMPVQMG